MNFHILQHVPFEGPANIGKWVIEGGHSLSYTKLYNNDTLPSLSEFDILIVMGGSMSINDVDSLIWMQEEIEFIKHSIHAEKPVLGICLGAQFIAKALNAKAYTGPNKEIGWFPTFLNKNALSNGFSKKIPEEITAFHWHSDTFDIPEGAVHFAHSAGTPNQGFVYKDIVWALQFHVEMNSESIKSMLKNCASDLTNDKYVQSSSVIQQGLINEINNFSFLNSILSYLSGRIN
jgi:GMP synthase-like glutamine amidotransferase